MVGRKAGKRKTLPSVAGGRIYSKAGAEQSRKNAQKSGSKLKAARSGNEAKTGSKVKRPGPSHRAKPEEQPVFPYAKGAKPKERPVSRYAKGAKPEQEPVSPYAMDDCEVDPRDGSKLKVSKPKHSFPLCRGPIIPELFTGADGTEWRLYNGTIPRDSVLISDDNDPFFPCCTPNGVVEEDPISPYAEGAVSSPDSEKVWDVEIECGAVSSADREKVWAVQIQYDL
ncbi:uncharacterized protein LOC112196371 isoform X2 [Rosa chinensis]|uniref:uncharacterized protein LOC112196371 isoform X2 n=1 Tax=Rosa chinensis TaxID=74649 RepID=UPI000D0892EC|nr:uncharacterized protein LOC112196371 isoform X2 [Rosa chinensis]